MTGWLNHEYRMSPASLVEDAVETTNYRAMLMEGMLDPPEQPEPLQLLRKLKRFGVSMWSGGYADQPHILLLELHTVIETEVGFQNSLLANQFLRAAHGTQDPEGEPYP